MERSRVAMGLLAMAVMGCAAEAPDDIKAPGSEGVVSLAGLSELGFNPSGAGVRFDVTGVSVATDPRSVRVVHNDWIIPVSSLEIAEDHVSAPYVLVEGRNDVKLLAQDQGGASLDTYVTLWAGSATLTVTVVDAAGAPVDGASVVAALGDDQRVRVEATTSGGAVSFSNLPDRTILLDARTLDNRSASVATTGGAGSVELVLRGFDAPSPVANNDFSQGLEGWNVGSAPVQLVPHQESSKSTRAKDLDLELRTSGEGPQSISRTFQIQPGTSNVAVRYRFQTDEVPGGYYGTEYNDVFSVTIRSLGSGGTKEANSMNGLSLGAFDASGATTWRELDLPTPMTGDLIQVDLTVANVADGAFDSRLIIDRIDERQLGISTFALYDLDGSALTQLSTDSHTYYGGNTRIHGDLEITGASETRIEEVTLEIVQNGLVVATAELSAAARAALLQELGSDRKVSFSGKRLLFELPSAQAALVVAPTNGTVTPRVRVRTVGQNVTRDAGAVSILVRFAGDATQRFGSRDTGNCIGTGSVVPNGCPEHDLDSWPCGGDDWLTPDARTLLEVFMISYPDLGLQLNDGSNMNGGCFPRHKTHRNGVDLDMQMTSFGTSSAKTADAADDLLALLRDPIFGARIVTIYVTWDEGSAFEQAIEGQMVPARDGQMRAATDVIVYKDDHADHFHMILSDIAEL